MVYRKDPRIVTWDERRGFDDDPLEAALAQLEACLSDAIDDPGKLAVARQLALSLAGVASRVGASAPREEDQEWRERAGEAAGDRARRRQAHDAALAATPSRFAGIFPDAPNPALALSRR